MRLLLAAFLAAALLIGGCGDSDGQGEGYGVELPGGWSDATEEAEDEEFPIRFDRLLRKEPEDGFATNVNVIREKADGVDLDEAQEQFAGQLQSFGAQDLSEARDTEVDGEEAFERDYSLSQQGEELRGRQVVVRRDRLYTITFTVPEDRFEDEVSEFEEILDSWRWD